MENSYVTNPILRPDCATQEVHRVMIEQLPLVEYIGTHRRTMAEVQR